MYYCCAETIKVFDVCVLPESPMDSPSKVRVHDVNMDPKTWYYADIERVQQTPARAIWAAKGALDDHDNEIYREMAKLQGQRDQIANLLCIGDPENDGT